MALITLENDRFTLAVSTHGGCIANYALKREGENIPLLRPVAVGEEVTPADASCFPLVPFGNRVKGNRFRFNQREYRLTPNTPGDPHYLHGDGWLAEWQCVAQQADHLILYYQHQQGPYRYRVEQVFQLDERGLTLTLNVWHLAEQPMPYGLGWHPYFPLTAETRIEARADSYWLEETGWLPGKRVPLAAPMNFNQPAPLPHRWVNNGFHGWDGRATVNWPERQLRLQLSTQPACPVYFLFIPDADFDPGYQFDFFCLEPMSHAANAHNMAEEGGLRVLEKGERLSQIFSLRCIEEESAE